jgi:hypothetical protein
VWPDDVATVRLLSADPNITATCPTAALGNGTLGSLEGRDVAALVGAVA